MLQLLFVKVSGEVVEMLRSPSPPDARAKDTSTFDAGCVARRIVKVALLPSETVNDVFESVRAAVSLSSSVKDTDPVFDA